MASISLLTLVLIVLLVFNWRHLLSFFYKLYQRLFSSTYNNDPVAEYRQQVELATESLRHNKQGLDRMRHLLEGVQQQVDESTREVARLQARLEAAHVAGDEARIAETARTLQAAQAHLQELQREATQHQQTFQEFARQVENAQNYVLHAKKEANQLGVELKMSQLGSEVVTREVPLPDPKKLDPLREEIDREKARQRVAQDLGEDPSKPPSAS